MLISNLPVSSLCGWGVRINGLFDHDATKQIVRESFDLWGDENDSFRLYPKLNIVGVAPYEAGKRSMLWEVGRKLLGTDPLNYPQQIGDCVSFGAKNAIEYVQFFPMANGDHLNWTMVFPPYLYGCGRVFIGNGQIGSEDGSLGAWQAKAVMEYGAVRKDESGLPEYSGAIARQWGVNPGPDKKWIELGKQHIVKSAAAVSSWEDMVQAITNGYPITIASNVGFDMKPRADGFHHYSTHWGHQVCAIGVDDDASEPHACILNSWGPDAHGVIKDFKTGDTWPGGTLRVRKADVEAMLREGDSFAYSSFTGFPAQQIDRDKFDLW
jgi:hypothetical protein